MVNLSPTSLLQAMTSGISLQAKSETGRQGMICLEQDVENAQNVVDNYGSTASQAVSSGVSKITSDALKAQDNSINDNY